mmetsp:Transcript_101313/g.285701  ORF Transcript_101313/g.285701 Transcript_101313/m.285701 type:complete len:207 (+) Transcript_101313:319-939(+)
MYQKYSPSPGRVCSNTGPPRSATARSVGRKTIPLKTIKRPVPSEDRRLARTDVSTCSRERNTFQTTSVSLALLASGLPLPAHAPCMGPIRRSTSWGLVTALPATSSSTSPSCNRPSHSPPAITLDTMSAARRQSVQPRTKSRAFSNVMPWYLRALATEISSNSQSRARTCIVARDDTGETLPTEPPPRKPIASKRVKRTGSGTPAM